MIKEMISLKQCKEKLKYNRLKSVSESLRIFVLIKFYLNTSIPTNLNEFEHN